ncbi:hypothetical protein BD309DRAFT_1016336 [Dichomitus squalens]|uniref:Uncharacterized protein n=1 Tax=Dichomitus squalens TaxID=114155 RepID=A0A4Q9PTE8_9APHY|nr:hypothetical protein BD309DRAFT_1016336 [Dichomitus squalens]TBU57665.1 hypothetical protein BD310DRAFT_536201 [Dichomitus squalens]
MCAAAAAPGRPSHPPHPRHSDDNATLPRPLLATPALSRQPPTKPASGPARRVLSSPLTVIRATNRQPCHRTRLPPPILRAPSPLPGPATVSWPPILPLSDTALHHSEAARQTPDRSRVYRVITPPSTPVLRLLVLFFPSSKLFCLFYTFDLVSFSPIITSDSSVSLSSPLLTLFYLVHASLLRSGARLPR